jgi:hypothetical protein
MTARVPWPTILVMALVAGPGMAVAAPAKTPSPSSAATRTAKVAPPIALLDLKQNITPVQAAGIVAAMTIQSQPIAAWFGAATRVAASEQTVQLNAAMNQAQAAMASLQCNDVTAPAAQTAALAAAAFVRGSGGGLELKTATRYQLRCADQNGQIDDAMYYAQRLRSVRALVGTLPVDDDIDRTLLARYPAIDAAIDNELIAVTIQAEAADGGPVDIWIDMQKRGVAPYRGFIGHGRHSVIAATPTQAVATEQVIDRRTATIQLTLPVVSEDSPTATPTQLSTEMQALLNQWRSTGLTTVQQQRVVAAIAAASQAKRVLVFDGSASTLWHPVGSTADGAVAFASVGKATVRSTTELASIADRANGSQANLRAPAPDQPLLLDNTLPARDADSRNKTQWWVYASVLGAVAAGAAVVYFNDVNNDRQRVEVRWQ